MTELALRQNVNDLEEVLRRDAQCADQCVLNRARHLVKTGLVVLSFEHMKFGEGHASSPLLVVAINRIGLRNPRYRSRIGIRPPPMRSDRASIRSQPPICSIEGPPLAHGRRPR